MTAILTRRPVVLPLLTFLITVLGAVYLYTVLQAREAQFVQGLVADRAGKISLLIHAETTAEFQALNRMGKRWTAANGTPEPQWRADVGNTVRNLEGLRAIEWVDSSYHVRWIEPEAGNEKAVGINILFDDERRVALEGAAQRGGITLTSPLKLLQGYEAILAYVPVRRSDGFDGFLVGVFGIQSLFSGVVTREMSDEFAVTILDGHKQLFASRPAQSLDDGAGALASTQVYDRSWTIRLTPTAQFTARHRSWLPGTTLVAGLLIACLLAAISRAIMLAREQAAVLADTNSLNQAIMASAASLIIATDRDGVVVQVNEAFEEAMGYSGAEIVARRTTMFWHDPAEVAARAVELTAELGRPVDPGIDVFTSIPREHKVESRDWTYVRRDGSRFMVNLTVTVLREIGGGIKGYLGIAEDVTERHAVERERALATERLRSSEQRHRMLIDGVANYAIYWLDAEGRVNSWNAGARNLKQYTEQEILGKNYSIFFTEEDRAKFMPQRALVEAARRGKFSSEGWRVRKDGSRFWASVQLEPIRDLDGTIVGFAKISHDETSRREADQRLSDTVQELNAVLGTMVDGLIILDDATRIMTFTPMAERIFGYQANEVLGRTVNVLLSESEQASPVSLAETFRAASTGVIGEGREIIARRKDGEEFPMEMGVSAYQIADRKRFVGVIRDITKRRRAEDALRTSEETFRSAMESASIGMALVSPNGRFMKVNTSLCELLGYTDLELTANDFQSITHPDDLDRDLQLVNQVLSGQIERYRLEKRYFHKSGRTIWIQLSVSLVRDALHQPNYFIAQIQDITEQKEIERMKNEFISVVSHELRTPLTSIRGSLGLILGAFSKDLPEKVSRLLEIGQSNCERLILLINDILDIDKIASGQMRFDMKERPLDKIVQKTVQAMESYARKFNVRIEVDPLMPPASLLVDEERLIQVLSNLLSNACKFSPPNAKVDLSVQAHGERLRISVTDAGAGIPEEFRGRIFQKFSQADSSSARRAGGTGLGLHITQQIVERMNGTIGFDSEVGKGTTFWVEFPVPAAQAPPADAVVEQILTQTYQPKILHVEDDPDLSNVIAAALQGRADVIPAAGIRQAESLLGQQRFALVILDVRLPDGSGLDLLERLPDLTDPVPPVVVLCADQPPAEIHRKVAAVMIKTRISEARIVESIVDVLEHGPKVVNG